MYKTKPHNGTVFSTALAGVMLLFEMLIFTLVVLPLLVLMLPFAFIQKAISA